MRQWSNTLGEYRRLADRIEDLAQSEIDALTRLEAARWRALAGVLKDLLEAIAYAAREPTQR